MSQREALVTLLDSFKYAIKGMIKFLASERNTRIHATCAAMVVGFGFWLKVKPGEWAILFLTITLVFTAEAFNTSIEKLVDMVSPERKPQAGLVKDIAAGAVLISALGAVIVGLMIFGPKIIDWFNQ